jgi:hypothetical protein
MMKKTSDKPTAPSTDDIQQFLPQQDTSQDDLAMQLAMDLMSSPEEKSNESNTSGGGLPSVPSYRGIDPKVMAATSELIAQFPQLKITSALRNWGDKDAHPKGRAIDVAGPDISEAFKYYRDKLVPKYQFNPALNPNHGTGPHIHVGYYKKGGLTQSQYLTQRGLKDAHDHGDFDNITPNQAREILHKKKVNGKPLTPEQFKLFGFLSKGNTLKYQKGGMYRPKY